MLRYQQRFAVFHTHTPAQISALYVARRPRGARTGPMIKSGGRGAPAANPDKPGAAKREGSPAESYGWSLGDVHVGVERHSVP